MIRKEMSQEWERSLNLLAAIAVYNCIQWQAQFTDGHCRGGLCPWWSLAG